MRLRDRHVRGVASGPALVGPSICTRRASEKPPLEGWEGLFRFATVALLHHPPRTLPQHDRAPVQERPARIHDTARSNVRLRVQELGDSA
jgi:hypothetical protein